MIDLNYHSLSSKQRGSLPHASINVGVPLHDALQHVKPCLESVVANRPTGTQLTIVDDGSSRETRRWLDQFVAEHDDVVRLRHGQAQGYTRSANEILTSSESDYVVLLNSDTIVSHDWLESIIRAGESASEIGILGPLSNAASWQSVPLLYSAGERNQYAVNALPSKWSVADAAFSVALAAPVVLPRVPLVNGFCYVVKRDVVRAIGIFDDQTFPVGYGEEDDYTFRAADAGFSAAIATETFVYHAKSQTFGQAREGLRAAGGEAFRGRWGTRRVGDAVRSMRHNPIMEERRRLVELAFDASIEDVSRSGYREIEFDGVTSPVARALLSHLARGLGIPGGDVGSTRGGCLKNAAVSADVVLSIAWSGEGPVTIRDDLHPDADLVLFGGARAGELGSTAPLLLLGDSPDVQRRRLEIVLRLAAGTRLARAEPLRGSSAPQRRGHRASLTAAPAGLAEARRDAFLRRFDADLATLLASRKITDAFRSDPRTDLTTVTWFVPAFDHLLRGGIRTIFSVANDLTLNLNTRHRFVVCALEEPDPRPVAESVRTHFPQLDATFVGHRYGDDVSFLPRSDAAICTLWTTAYELLRYNQCCAKFYLVQDWEPTFYRAGARSALIEESYRFGFIIIANSPGVAERCRSFSDWVGVFLPGVDQSMFCPSDGRDEGPPYQIVFYGRPGNARNAFELGAAGLAEVKRELGDDVSILSAGADYKERDVGVEGVIDNLGVLPTLDEVASLYRSSHLGVVFMLTAHPSYQPLEYMASGCATVTNFNPNNTWLLRHRENCLIAPSTPSGVAETIVTALEDVHLRRRIVRGGLDTVGGLTWKDAHAAIRRFLLAPTENALGGVGELAIPEEALGDRG